MYTVWSGYPLCIPIMIMSRDSTELPKQCSMYSIYIRSWQIYSDTPSPRRIICDPCPLVFLGYLFDLTSVLGGKKNEGNREAYDSYGC